jgi:hypothetical protein
MNNREFYQDTFSQVHSSQSIKWEEMKSMKKEHKPVKKIVLLAAVIGILASFSAVAAATDLFGLRDLLLPKEEIIMPIDPETGEQETKTVDVISLSGYQDTPESKALTEWRAFLDSYDTDGAIISAIGNDPTGFEEKYGQYLVYTQEMADKLDAIVEKYGLKLHREMVDLLSDEALTTAVGGDFLAENHAYSAYMYDDGTFQYDGNNILDDYGLVDYQFRRVVRGVFDDVLLNITDASQYQEWTYTTACGVPVTLALSPYKALILVDLPDCFVTVNVLAGTETDPEDIFSSGPLSAEDLESLADSFDFAVLSPVEVHQLPYELTEAGILEETHSDEPGEDAQEFFADFVQAVENDDRKTVVNMIDWPRQVTVSEGTFYIETAEDFLPYYDEIFTESLLDEIHANQYTEDRADLFAEDGFIVLEGGSVWFRTTGDGFAIETVQDLGWWSIRGDS